MRTTPTDLVPVDMEIPTMTQINHYTVQITWTPVNEFTEGIEGNFQYYELQIVETNSITPPFVALPSV